MRLKKYENNPILKPNPNCQWENFCVLNPGVVFDEKREKFVMLYRAAGDDKEHLIRFGLAESDDGINFTRCGKEPAMDVNRTEPDGGCIEDPRIVEIDGVYYITYAARAFFTGKYWLCYEDYIKEYGEPKKYAESVPHFAKKNSTVSYLAMTEDFKYYKRLGRITDSRYDDRDVVLFPERINGKYVKLSRPKFPEGKNADCKMPSVWITFSDDLLEWGEPQLLFTGEQWWETERIGAGCPPIRTDKGWLLIYHGVAADQEYRVGFVLLDINQPSRILARTKDFVMEPEYDYEKNGLYNGCVFPTGCVLKNDILYIYYGCADKYIALATVSLTEVFEEIGIRE